jgi:hypothetical protein
MSIVAVSRLASNSRVIAFDTRLQARAFIQDIYTDLEGLYNRKNESFPKNSIMAKVKDQTTYESRITLREAYQEEGVYGTTAAVGTEETVRTKYAKTFQNTWRKVVAAPGYGLRKLEAENYKLYEENEEGVTNWRKEDKGYGIRHALLESYSPNLLTGDSSTDCVAAWNMNFFIPTLPVFEQPEWDSDLATFTNNICGGLVAAGGFDQFTARTLTATILEDISNYALYKRLLPLSIPGLPTGEGYVLTVSEIQAAYLSNPIWTSNNLGTLWHDMTQQSEIVQQWRGVIGSYNNILIICDPRIPTLLPGGSAEPYSLTAGYMVWDSRDLRYRNRNHVKDVAILHGRGAFIRVEGEPEHWIADERDYGMHKGLGIAGVCGDQLPVFIDEDTDDRVNQTSAIVLLDLPNHGTLSTL